MGIIAQGILGGFSGKVGNVIGASWKGINYIRIKPVSVANPRTEGQVNQRNKFSATLEFLKPSLAFVKTGYKFFANKQSAFNAAMSYVIQNAMTGTAPNFTVDYALALVSRGSLTGASNGAVTINPGGAEVSWNDNSAEGNARPDDKPMILAYNPAKKESIVILESTDTRTDGATTFTVPTHFAGDSLEFYLSFQTADGRAVSDSSYLGSHVAQ